LLVLSRHKNETIWIGDVKLIVVETRPNRCRLGFDAPQEVPIHRGEVRDAMRASEGQSPSLAKRDTTWLHTWEHGVYRGAQKCSEVNLASMMNPGDASYNGVFYCITNSPECPVA